MNGTVMTGLTILTGDCRETLRSIGDKSVHCCVTSPPYWGLRDYGHANQIGQEATPELFVQTMVEVFREVRRVLKADGTCWLNLGDSYFGSWGNYSGGNRGKEGGQREIGKGSQVPNPAYDGLEKMRPPTSLKHPSLKPKDIVGIPWRVAFALQADGWYLRQDIIWAKPNPMPESVTDRCTKSHEYIFLLSKSPKYFFDAEAIKEPATYAGQMRGGSKNRYEQNSAGMDCKEYSKRNKRSVWSVKPASYKGAHFAVFPPELIEPCVLAGCPVSGVVLDPFGGSGTTAGVALANNRKAISCELNPEYSALHRERIDSIVRKKVAK